MRPPLYFFAEFILGIDLDEVYLVGLKVKRMGSIFGIIDVEVIPDVFGQSGVSQLQILLALHLVEI